MVYVRKKKLRDLHRTSLKGKRDCTIGFINEVGKCGKLTTRELHVLASDGHDRLRFQMPEFPGFHPVSHVAGTCAESMIFPFFMSSIHTRETHGTSRTVKIAL
jgi:hypothetical protein